jgi:hypothetical protein
MGRGKVRETPIDVVAGLSDNLEVSDYGVLVTHTLAEGGEGKARGVVFDAVMASRM